MRHMYSSVALSRLRPLFMILYLALAGTATVVGTTLYLHVPFSPLMALVCMATIFSVYTLNRFTDMREDFANDSHRAVFFAQRKKLLHAVWPVLGMAVVALTLTANMSVYFVALFGLGFIYSCRVVPWYDFTVRRTRFIRLKDVPVMKNVLVALLWGVSPFAIPLLLGPVHASLPQLFYLGVLSASLVLSTFNNTVFCDVLDEPGDRFAGQRTLPVIMGQRATLTMLVAMDTAWLAMVCVLARIEMLDTEHTLFLVALALYPVVYLLPHWRGWLKRKSLEFLCETDLVVFAAGLAVLSFV